MKKFIAGLVIGLLIATAGVGFAAGEIIQATFAKFNFVVNGEAKTLETDPLVYQGTTYLPVRVVSNLLGYDVTYKADSRTIELVSVRNETENNEKGDESVETAIDINLNEWIPLRTFAQQYTAAYGEYIMPLQDQLPSSDAEYGEYEILTAKGMIKAIYFQYNNYLKIEDLKTKGIIPQ